MEAGEGLEAALADDDRAPDEDDFDATEYPDPDELESAEPPEDFEGDDRLVADAPPQPPAEQDAPLTEVELGEDLDPGLFADEGGLPPALISAEEATAEAVIRRRWLGRLRMRKEFLANARQELAHATTEAQRQAARAKVKMREEQVAYAERVLERRKTTVVERVLRAAMLGVAHTAQIAYSQDLTLRWAGISKGLRAKNGQFPRQADCSSFVTWCYWDALGGPTAGPDILNGSGWRSGNTTSLKQHGRRVAVDQARRGDLVFYGAGEHEHVTVVVSPGKVVSHGRPQGPEVQHPLNYRRARDLTEVRRYVT
jgi:cell wall-associated NlpC family hydrolase